MTYMNTAPLTNYKPWTKSFTLDYDTDKGYLLYPQFYPSDDYALFLSSLMRHQDRFASLPEAARHLGTVLQNTRKRIEYNIQSLNDHLKDNLEEQSRLYDNPLVYTPGTQEYYRANNLWQSIDTLRDGIIFQQNTLMQLATYEEDYKEIVKE